MTPDEVFIRIMEASKLERFLTLGVNSMAGLFVVFLSIKIGFMTSGAPDVTSIGTLLGSSSVLGASTFASLSVFRSALDKAFGTSSPPPNTATLPKEEKVQDETTVTGE